MTNTADNQPRKEAIRPVIDVIKRAKLPSRYNGHHRVIASFIIDKCESFTHESPYKTRFRIENDVIVALVKRRPVAVFDLLAFKAHITDNVVSLLNVHKLRTERSTLGEIVKDFPWCDTLKEFDWRPSVARV
jgi:hypothetical protein